MIQGVVYSPVLPQDDGQGGRVDERGEVGERFYFCCCSCAGRECGEGWDAGGAAAV